MENWITPEKVCEIVPGMTTGALSQRRYMGLPPAYAKPSPKVVVYDEAIVRQWVRNTTRTQTGEALAS